MKQTYRAGGGWATLGLEIVLCVLVGYFGGYWLDGRFGTTPWIAVVGFLFGCGAAAKAIHRSLKEMQAVTAREERRKGNPAPVYERPEDREPPAGPGAREGGSLGASPDPMDASEDHDERAP